MSSTIRGDDGFDSAKALRTTGLASAWVNFNGSGVVAIRDSYNVDSVVDTATGIYTVNFTTNMDNANYAIQSLGSNDNATLYYGNSITAVPLVGSYSVKVGTGSPLDLVRVMNVVHGGLD